MADRRTQLAELVERGVDPVDACKQLGYARPVQAARQAGYKPRKSAPAPEQVPDDLPIHALAHARLKSIIQRGEDTQAISASRAALDHRLAADSAGVSVDGAGHARLVMIVPSNGRGPEPRHVIEVGSEQQANDLFAFASGVRERVVARVALPTVVVDAPALEPELAPIPEPIPPDYKKTTRQVRRAPVHIPRPV